MKKYEVEHKQNDILEWSGVLVHGFGALLNKRLGTPVNDDTSYAQ